MLAHLDCLGGNAARSDIIVDAPGRRKTRARETHGNDEEATLVGWPLR